MGEARILDAVIEKFVSSEINLSPYPITNNNGDIIKPGLDNHSMGTLFEELIRKFNEENNEEAGEHFTPRDVVELMGELAIIPVIDKIKDSTYTLYDGACGTLGMCTVASEILQKYAAKNNKTVSIHMFGQEINPETYAISKADTLIKGDEAQTENIFWGSTISNDQTAGKKFDFMLSNPPYGKTWKTDLALLAKGGISKDLKENVNDPRFVVNFKGESEYRMIPDVSDGQLLFLLNNISKMKDTQFGSRIVEVHNGSALFTGDAGNGASNARRYMIEKDLIEAIIQLPENIFYNTGITTHIWILSNRKEEKRKGKIQLIDASSFKTTLRKNLGQKNCEISEDDKKKILDLYINFREDKYSKIFNNEDFGYYKITVDRPLKVAINLSKENFEKINSIYSELEIGTKNINKSKLADYGLKDSKGAILELSNSEKMLAYLEILKQLVSSQVYLDLVEFTTKFDNLAKETKIKGLNYSSFEKTGFISLLIEKNENAAIQKDNKGNIIVDPDLRDTEIVPLNYNGGINQFMIDEVLPYHNDAFVSEKDTKIGYEISFSKHFYVPKKLDKVEDIVKRIQKLEAETDGLLSKILDGLYEEI
ncbi:HsdM family class I SAM-dependent methyltransferase [Ureaplasma diversum]|uniref:HsdM family class I SAM-dependent methyltransferase n=1 Tax=Ureaplasma diversum TaxID=42094 RepID=UPI000ADF888D|nr:class I SAM-dependent DNA methyltransferase [Ureaplasma diversum]